MTESILTGRKYIVVRAIADTPVSPNSHDLRSDNSSTNRQQDETGREAQRRIIREFYETVEEVEPV